MNASHMRPALPHSQRPIWIGQQRTPDSPLYNMAFTFLFEGAIDAERFRDVWRRIVSESDVLRTRIVERGGLTVRSFGHPDEYETTFEDFSAQANAETA